MILLSDTKLQGESKQIKLRPITFRTLDESIEENSKDEKVNQLRQLTEQIATEKIRLEDIKKEIEIRRHDSELEIKRKQEDWKIEKEKMIEETKKLGFEEGYQDGKAEGLKNLSEKIEQADQIVESSRSQQLKVIDQSESIILELATKIASKIMAYEIEENTGFLQLVKQAIQEVHDQPSIKLYTSLDDYELVLDQQDQLMTLLDPEIVLSIHPSDTLKQGGCIIKTPYSKIDASVDEQLAKIKTRLFELMEEIRREHQ